MAVIFIAEFDIEKLTPSAINLLKAAVSYAYCHRDIEFHTITIRSLCDLANLREHSTIEIAALLNEARKALASIESLNTEANESGEDFFASWQIIEDFTVYDSYVSFKIKPWTFDERLLSRLEDLDYFRNVRARIAS